MMLRLTGFDLYTPFSEDLKMISNMTKRVNEFDTFRATIKEMVINGVINDEIVALLDRQGL
jgi:hypothetical protein